ncbi:MAG: GNAT family protein [Sedimentibacter sp.]|uniref:GNAT family N-acetyltransferase n=1 Tax=Sedimentibacter sp. TaxID=1960295 RepID=UPI0031586594
MRDIMINGEKLIIRRSKKSDAKDLVDYINSVAGETDYLSFGVGEFGMTVQQEEDFIENTSKKENALSLIAEINGKVVANLNFSGGARRRVSHVGEFGISVQKEYWGHGIGEELIRYLIDWCKSSGTIRKINLRARTDNARGIRLYKKLGFEEEGVLKRDLMVDGIFYDSLCMGLLID